MSPSYLASYDDPVVRRVPRLPILLPAMVSFPCIISVVSLSHECKCRTTYQITPVACAHHNALLCATRSLLASTVCRACVGMSCSPAPCTSRLLKPAKHPETLQPAHRIIQNCLVPQRGNNITNKTMHLQRKTPSIQSTGKKWSRKYRNHSSSSCRLRHLQLAVLLHTATWRIVAANCDLAHVHCTAIRSKPCNHPEMQLIHHSPCNRHVVATCYHAQQS
jgi:hypothetical protein